MGRQAHVVEHYLNSYVFPETMEHQVFEIDSKFVEMCRLEII
jgi:hypothetical protein